MVANLEPHPHLNKVYTQNNMKYKVLALTSDFQYGAGDLAEGLGMRQTK